jgi:hypothetical protein
MASGAARAIVVAVLGASAIAVMPAAARSATACARSGATIAADSQARVFRRGKVSSGETKGAPLYYGCSLRTGHVQRLNRRGGFGTNRVTASTIRLAGPYAGYVETDVEAAGELPFATVIDVRGGRLVRNPQASDLEDGRVTIAGLVLTARGSEAWIARDCMVAHAAAIAPHSLALAANSHDIYWTEGGVARRAPIG